MLAIDSSVMRPSLRKMSAGVERSADGREDIDVLAVATGEDLGRNVLAIALALKRIDGRTGDAADAGAGVDARPDARRRDGGRAEADAVGAVAALVVDVGAEEDVDGRDARPTRREAKVADPDVAVLGDEDVGGLRPSACHAIASRAP